jgi:hypothetical protein
MHSAVPVKNEYQRCEPSDFDVLSHALIVTGIHFAGYDILQQYHKGLILYAILAVLFYHISVRWDVNILTRTTRPVLVTDLFS